MSNLAKVYFVDFKTRSVKSHVQQAEEYVAAAWHAYKNGSGPMVALRMYRKALALVAPYEYPHAYVYAATCLTEADRDEESLHLYLDVYEGTDYRDFEMLYNIASIYHDTYDEYKEAKRFFRESLAHASCYCAWYWLGHCHAKLNELPSARKAYATSIRLYENKDLTRPHGDNAPECLSLVELNNAYEILKEA